MNFDDEVEQTRHLCVRVFAGGYDSPQLTYFRNGIEILDRLIPDNVHFHGAESTKSVGYRYVHEMRSLRWSPNDLVDWLLDCDIHFIVTHPSRKSTLGCFPTTQGTGSFEDSSRFSQWRSAQLPSIPSAQICLLDWSSLNCQPNHRNSISCN